MRIFPEVQEFRLTVPYSLEECREILKPHMESEWKVFGDATFRGFFKNNRLYVRKRISYQNSFQRVLDANVIAESNKTTFIGSIQIDPKVKAFSQLWIIAWGLLSLVFAFSNPSLKTIGVGIGGILFALGLIKYGAYCSQGEPDFIKSYITEVFQVGIISQ